MSDKPDDKKDEPGKIPDRFLEVPEVWVAGHKISDPDKGIDKDALERVKRHLKLHGFVQRRKSKK